MNMVTLSVRNTMNFVAPFLKNQPLMVSNMEPAVGVANMVLGLMLSPPLRWRQNRRETSFLIGGSPVTDYSETVAKFGYIETAWLIDGSGNQHPLSGALSLTINEDTGRPEKISPQFDDNADTIIFRFDKTPDEQYTCFVDYQQAAPLISSPASGWGPIPDYFNHIFNFGFLAIISLLVNDSRFPIFEKYFVGRLLAAQSGLTEQEKNIFLGNWAAAAATMKRADMGVAGLSGI